MREPTSPETAPVPFRSSPAPVRAGSRRSLAFWALLCATALGTASTAHAFRPSARWIVDQAVKYRLQLKIKALEVEAEIVRYDLGELGPQGGSGRVLLMQPRSFRIETPRPDGLDVTIVTPSKTLVDVGGNKSKQRTRPDFLVDFMTIGPSMDRRKSTDRLMNAMKSIGVNADVVSYSRFDDRVAYLIGSKSFEDDKPQVWLDKDSLRLLRVVRFSTGADGKRHRIDTQLTGYGSPEGGAWWPKRMVTYEDGKLQQRWVTRRVNRLDTVDANAFVIE